MTSFRDLPMVYREREGEGQALPVPCLPCPGLLEPSRGEEERRSAMSLTLFLLGLAQCERQSLNVLKTSQQLRALPAPLE